MLLTPEQLYEIQKIITQHHEAFTVNTIGPTVVPPEVLKELQAKGLIKQSLNTIGEAYTYGQLLGTLENEKIATMSYGEFKNHVRKNPIPLTEIERGAMEMAAQSAGQYCRGLGNRAGIQTGTILIDVDRQLRARMEADIRTATEANIARRESVEQLKSDLGWATKDWARDLKRIAITEKVTAMNQGTSDHFKKRYGADTLVAKRSMPDSCPHCARLYNGPSGPRVFKLSTLEGNGTNVGRKANDWLATVGSTHPNCACVLTRVPAGWGWDEFGDLVPGGKVDMYESPEELALAMLQEDDLQKAFALQGHLTFQGIPIAIENKEGSVRKWTDVTGETGETKMVGVSYGYAQGTIGADSDAIDVFVGPDPRAGLVYVIEQQNAYTGVYDEQKCMLGFPNQDTAERAYKLHYDNPDNFFITIQPMEVEHFKRWIEGTKPKDKELTKAKDDISKFNQDHLLDPEPNDSTKLVVLIPDRLEKAAARGGKYIKRVPYYKDGKKKYRYYYAESAAARDVKEGETIKLGKQFANVKSIDKDGTIHLDIEGKTLKVKANQWDSLLTRYYGSAYLNWAEKRAQQSVNAVLKRVPKYELADLKGTTDKERLAELKERVPKVYGRLEKSFNRAGVNPFRAKQVLTRSLERKGWEPEARAAVIGDVITKRNKNYQTTIRAAENLAGGGKVKVGHVAAVTEIVQKVKAPKNEIASLAEQAEKEMATLSALIAKARKGGNAESADALAAALSSQAVHKLNLISKAFPGVADKAVEPAREIMLEVPSVAPKQAPKSVGSTTDVYVAGEGGAPKALNAKYKLMEANDAIASHDPSNFNRRKDYPEGVQERAYHRDKDEQAKVVRNAQKLIPAFVINTNSDAVNGAPIMGPDGVILGGNSRTMSVQRAYAKHPEKGEEFKNYLRENAHQTGFTKEDVDQFENPILVRVLEHGGENLEDKQLLVRQMNESFTQSMDPRTEQVAWGRKLTDEAVRELGNAMDPDETLSEFLGSPRAQGFIGMLERTGIIDQRTANRYFDKKARTKTLNVDGKALVAGVLVGRMVKDADLLSTTKTSIVDSVAKTVPYIEQAKEFGSGYDLSDDFKVALDAYNYLQRIPEKRKSMKPDMPRDHFDRLFGQLMLGDVIREPHPVQDNPKAMNLLEILIRRSGSKQIVSVFKDYADRASHNIEGEGRDTGLLGDKKTPAQILDDITRKHADKAFKDAAAKKKAKEPEPEPEMPMLGLLGKSEPVFVIPEGLDKAWGYFVGPKGGKWKDPGHTIPWVEPEKETGRTKLGEHNPESGDIAPLPGQTDIYEYAEKEKTKKKFQLQGKPKKVTPQLSKGKPIRTPVVKQEQGELDKGLDPIEGAGASRAGNRAPGPGLGVNYVIPMPKRQSQGQKDRGYFPGKDELIDEKLEDEEGALHVDIEEYDFAEPQRKVLPIDVDPYVEANEDAREGTEERGRYVKNEPLNNLRRPKNKVERTPVKDKS